ncbi:MAG: hypothetical protein QOJ16_532, partial [Acidobacteriota bacterium]|nr:hypothetical protein [Acidobacteriota bacterium]
MSNESRAREVRRSHVLPLAVGLGLLLALARGAGAGEVQLLTRSDPGFRSDTASGASVTSPGSSMSGDGRYLVFSSTAPNLAPGQVEGPSVTSDVFLFDRVTGARTLVSHNAGSANTAGNGPSYSPVLSADGRWVAFLSA